MKDRFIRWLLSAILTEWQRLVESIIVQMQANLGVLNNGNDRVQSDLAVLNRMHTELAILTDNSDRMRTDLDVITDNSHKALKFPQMTMATLQAWEAVGYSAEKFAKDGQQHGRMNRDVEVMRWACNYLRENDWPIPDRDVMNTLLVLYDKLSVHRRANKYA